MTIPDIINERKGTTTGTFLTWQTINAKTANKKPKIGTKLNGKDSRAIIQANFETFLVSDEYA